MDVAPPPAVLVQMVPTNNPVSSNMPTVAFSAVPLPTTSVSSSSESLTASTTEVSSVPESSEERKRRHEEKRRKREQKEKDKALKEREKKRKREEKLQSGLVAANDSNKRRRDKGEETIGCSIGKIGSAPVPVLADGVSLPLAADTAKAAEAGVLQDFGQSMIMKPDHALRPMIVCPTGHIYLEMTHPISKPAADFLVTIAEPVSRPENVHEFQITVFSLYAAIGVGMTMGDILRNLNKFSKNDIPNVLEQLLKLHGAAFGRVKIVLRDNRYFLEATTRDDLEYMLSNPVIAENRIRNSMATRQVRLRTTAPGTTAESTVDGGSDNIQLDSAEAPRMDPSVLGFKLSNAGADQSTAKPQQTQTAAIKQVYLFEVKADHVGKVKESALTELKRPLVSEYDFRRDTKNPVMDIALKPATKIRYYQERALRKMFSNGRARSGIIVLPCGAGKTLTGITAATTIRKSAMILTSSSVAVDQWKRSFTDFTTLDPDLVITLTSDQKKDLPEGAGVLVSTYTMMSYSGKRSAAAEKILNQIRDREWGLLIFDEINDIVKSHCKLGLTATLVREDDLIHDLQWLIGPKLYEANWLELQEAGYLAKVQVSEVWCPMTSEFFKEYLTSPHARQRKLWVCNPNKLRVCEYLLRFHEARNDKIIVFSDNLFALKEVACTLKRPFISGEVGMQERMVILNKFKSSPKLNTIFLSKVGDNAIDIPCANVVIQISFNFASRRQEAQRLGRILRPKPKSDEQFNAFFYSLISKDTQEMLYADKRQQFIIDQGYSYKVLPITVFPMADEELIFDDMQRQRDLLVRIHQTNDQSMDIEYDDVVLNDSAVDMSTVSNAADDEISSGKFTTVSTVLSNLSRGTGRMLYREGAPANAVKRKGAPKKRPADKETHSFFKNFRK